MLKFNNNNVNYNSKNMVEGCCNDSEFIEYKKYYTEKNTKKEEPEPETPEARDKRMRDQFQALEDAGFINYIPNDSPMPRIGRREPEPFKLNYEEIKRLVSETKGKYYLEWSATKEIKDNFTVLPKFIDAMLKDKAEENPKLKGEPSNMHRNLAQCIIDEEYKHLTPEEREPDCYAEIEFEDVLIITKCWGFNVGSSTEDHPLVCAVINAYLNTFSSYRIEPKPEPFKFDPQSLEFKPEETSYIDEQGSDLLWFGDPCYVVPNELWDSFCGFDSKNQVKVNYKNLPCDFFVWSTAYGDGCFDLKKNGDVVAELGVDAGMLSMIPMRLIKQWMKESGEKLGDIGPGYFEGGYALQGSFQGQLIVEKGNMSFGDITILTDW